MPTTLADRLAQRDAERFVGRAAELALFEQLLDGDQSVSVVLVHGPGGIGKSSLLREVARRAATRGWTPALFDGRELALVPGELEDVFTAAQNQDRPLILLDTYERLSALDGLLRRRLLPALPARALVVLAGREPPAPEWFSGGWEHVTRVLALPPLSAAEGRALVQARGDITDQTASALVDWSSGLPLALTLATELARHEGAWDGRDFAQDPELVDLLVRRLVGAQGRDEHADVSAVAAIASVTTTAMLADVLPGRDAAADYAWLRRQAISEPVGDGQAMHALVRRALRAQLRLSRPERERELRARIAEHLFTRAASGEPRLIVELTELIDDPVVRWGFGADGASELRADALLPGELDAPSADILARGSDAWWGPTRKLAAAAPEHFTVVRDAADTLCGLAIAATPANATPAALADPFFGRWIEHARTHIPAGDAILWRDSMDLTTSRSGDLGSRVLAIVNTAAVLRSGLTNPRFFYLPINPVNAASVAFAQESGSRHVPELDVDVGDLRHQCHVIDYGPDGLLGSQRDRVYAELGVVRAPKRALVTHDDVRQALRDLDRPSVLAVGPLAAAIGGDDPAIAVRALLERGLERTFGDGTEEQLMRDLVRRAYFDPTVTHEQAADQLHVSRTTYFRRLRDASARVADTVLTLLP